MKSFGEPSDAHRSNSSDGACARRLSTETTVSIVVPCYNEEAVVPLLFERVRAEAERWPMAYEVIVVDDGSTDGTWERLWQIHQRDSRWKLIRFARNFGQQTALRAGIQAARGDLVVLLDADLQDPPEVLPEMFEHWAAGNDVVVGVRQGRKEGPFLRAAYFVFYRLLAALSAEKMPLDGGDFCVMDRRIVDIIRRMPERRPFIRGLRSWVGFRQTVVTYDRAHRAAGKPKYTMWRLFGLALDGILSSSILPLRFATIAGTIVAAVALLGVLVTLFVGLFPQQAAIFGLHKVPGSVSIVIAILFLGAVQLLCLGVFGEYLGRIYDNVNGRPFWTVREAHGIRDEQFGNSVKFSDATELRTVIQQRHEAGTEI